MKTYLTGEEIKVGDYVKLTGDRGYGIVSVLDFLDDFRGFHYIGIDRGRPDNSEGFVESSLIKLTHDEFLIYKLEQ